MAQLYAICYCYLLLLLSLWLFFSCGKLFSAVALPLAMPVLLIYKERDGSIYGKREEETPTYILLY